MTSWDLGALGDRPRRPACTPKSTTSAGDSVSTVPVFARVGDPEGNRDHRDRRRGPRGRAPCWQDEPSPRRSQGLAPSANPELSPQLSKQPGSPLFGDISLSESHGSGLRPAPNRSKLGQVPGHLGQGGGCQQGLTGSGTSRRLPCGMGTTWGPTWATRDGVFLAFLFLSQRPRLIPFWRLQEGQFVLF